MNDKPNYANWFVWAGITFLLYIAIPSRARVPFLALAFLGGLIATKGGVQTLESITAKLAGVMKGV